MYFLDRNGQNQESMHVWLCLGIVKTMTLRYTWMPLSTMLNPQVRETG
jgi:hypothetical protein